MIPFAATVAAPGNSSVLFSIDFRDYYGLYIGWLLLNDNVVYAEVLGKGETEVVEDYDKLAKDLESASPLEIMDKALQNFGNDIAIAFRYFLVFHSIF